MNNTENLSGEMESTIINAATQVFVNKGRSGASMQDIADEAGINRTLLNYYFRSKDKLFALVFFRVMNDLIESAEDILRSDSEIIDKIEDFIELYIRSLIDNPTIPIFILNELSTNPEMLVEMVKTRVSGPLPIIDMLEKAMEEGIIKKADPTQLIINLIAMVVFPFAAKTALSGVLLNDLGIEFKDLMEERIPFLREYFIKSIIA